MKQQLSSVLMFQIDQTLRTAKKYSQREIDEVGLGITVDQWVLLKILEEAKTAPSQKELAALSGRDPASITRTIPALEKLGLINREYYMGSRRKFCVNISARGKKLIAKHMDMIIRHRTKTIEGISEKDLETAMKVLRKVQNNLNISPI